METIDELTFAQEIIRKKVQEKKDRCSFQDNWVEYEEYYDSDYNDCHGDYYDAE